MKSRTFSAILWLPFSIYFALSAHAQTGAHFPGDLSVTGTTSEPTNAIWFHGEWGNDFPTDLEGTGRKFFWYPALGAIRAGQLTTWVDDEPSNIGQYSAAFGNGAVASGANSFASGMNTEASGSGAVSMGVSSNATIVSAAFGGATDAADTGSFAAGTYSAALAMDAVALNRSTVAAGRASFAAGWETEAESLGEFVVGVFNLLSDGNPNPSSWEEDDFLFVIGNGEDDQNRSNAVVVRKSGDTEINGDLAVSGELTFTHISPQGDIDMGKFGSE